MPKWAGTLEETDLVGCWEGEVLAYQDMVHLTSDVEAWDRGQKF